MAAGGGHAAPSLREGDFLLSSLNRLLGFQDTESADGGPSLDLEIQITLCSSLLIVGVQGWQAGL